MSYFVLLIVASSVFFTNDAFAYGRGGSCGENTFCYFTGSVVGVIILGLFLLSVIVNILEKGFVKGLTEHAGVKAIFFYCTGMLTLVWVLSKLAQYDKSIAIVFCIAMFFILLKLLGKMKKVILLGTEHSIQRGQNFPDLFTSILVEECEKNKVNAIAEEIIEGEETVASKFASDRQLKYLYADPNKEDRLKGGIPTRIDVEMTFKYMDKYPEVAIWNEETLPTEVREEFSKRTEKAHRMREKVWLENILNFDHWPLLFICGADHFDEFSKLLKTSKIQVVESHKHWIPNQK